MISEYELDRLVERYNAYEEALDINEPIYRMGEFDEIFDGFSLLNTIDSLDSEFNPRDPYFMVTDLGYICSINRYNYADYIDSSAIRKWEEGEE